MSEYNNKADVSPVIVRPCLVFRVHSFFIVCPYFGLSVSVSPLMSAYSVNRIINRAPLTFQFAP